MLIKQPYNKQVKQNKTKMKKVLFILGLAISTVSFGQKKSDKFVSGTVSYTKSTGVDGIFSVNPTIGYYVTDKVSVGVFGEVGKNSTDKTTNVGVFGRCDFLSIGKNCKVFSQVSLATENNETAGVKTKVFDAELTLGANYFITPRLALTMNIANLIDYESADGNSTMTIGFQGVNNPLSAGNFGLFYRF